MTRINANINPKYLTDEQLFVEYREIKRIPWYLIRALNNSSVEEVLQSIPSRFTLKDGHIKFFYDKQNFLLKRISALYEECLNRGFNVTYFISNWEIVHKDELSKFWNDWVPSESDNNLVRNRIAEKIRISKKKCFHYNHLAITKQEAITILYRETSDNLN